MALVQVLLPLARPGMLVAATALLEKNNQPVEGEVMDDLGVLEAVKC